MQAASVVFAAGKGSRMIGYDGNKTLLPLIPERGPYHGKRPLIQHVIENLPSGSKIVVVHHRKEELIAAVQPYRVLIAEQPETNGTGGALLSAVPLLERVDEDRVLITMGDVPLVRKASYEALLETLSTRPLAVLAFRPRDPKRYGALEVQGDRVTRIREWEYWREYPPELKKHLSLFNAGIYAGRRTCVLEVAEELRKRPHRVTKEREGRRVSVSEYFITDLVELAAARGWSVGWVLCRDEREVIGVDTPEALVRVQELYAAGTVE